MHVVWVTGEPPDFALGGGAIRQAHLLAGLARGAGPVDLVTAGRVTDPAVRALVSSVTEVPPPPRRPGPPAGRGARRRADLHRVLVSRLPAEVSDRRAERGALGAELRRRLTAGAGRPDVVHAEHLGLAAGVVPDGWARLTSLGIQNIPSRMADQARALAPGRRQRWLLATEAANARRFERRAVAGVDVVAVVSEQDAGDLGLAPGSDRVLVVPNGVDASRLVPTPLPAAPVVAFTGTLDYLPNVDGARWFAEEVLPLVRREIPGVVWHLVGRSPVAEVRDLARLAGVSLSVDVPDIAPHLAAARVVVAPVRIGSGSRVKVLEAMAAGRPVVATPTALEGLDVQPGTEALVAADAAGLAAAMVRLCRDDALAAAVGSAGRALVERLYQWRIIADHFAADLAAAATFRA